VLSYCLQLEPKGGEPRRPKVGHRLPITNESGAMAPFLSGLIRLHTTHFPAVARATGDAALAPALALVVSVPGSNSNSHTHIHRYVIVSGSACACALCSSRVLCALCSVLCALCSVLCAPCSCSVLGARCSVLWLLPSPLCSVALWGPGIGIGAKREVGRVLPASPHLALAATKTGQEAGVCPGKALSLSLPPATPTPAPRRAQRATGNGGCYRRSQARAGQRNTTGESERAESESQFQGMLDPETRLAALFRSWGGRRGA
jgi:hypothetical protein